MEHKMLMRLEGKQLFYLSIKLMKPFAWGTRSKTKKKLREVSVSYSLVQVYVPQSSMAPQNIQRY